MKSYVVCCVVNEDDGSVTQPVGFDTQGQARKWFASYVKEYRSKVGVALLRLVKLAILDLSIDERFDDCGEPSYALDSLRVNGVSSGFEFLIDTMDFEDKKEADNG